MLPLHGSGNGEALRKQKLPIFRRRSKSFGVIFTLESSEGGKRRRRRRRNKRNARRGGESNPFIRLPDECRSMATLWALAERTLRAYCLVSTASSPSPSTTSESIYLRTFKAPAGERPPLKDTANWLRIDLSPFPFPRLDSFCKSRSSVVRGERSWFKKKKKS